MKVTVNHIAFFHLAVPASSVLLSPGVSNWLEVILVTNHHNSPWLQVKCNTIIPHNTTIFTSVRAFITTSSLLSFPWLHHNLHYHLHHHHNYCLHLYSLVSMSTITSENTTTPSTIISSPRAPSTPLLPSPWFSPKLSLSPQVFYYHLQKFHLNYTFSIFFLLGYNSDFLVHRKGVISTFQHTEFSAWVEG